MRVCTSRGLDRDHVSANRGQIRSRDRVRHLAEVYTHEREVNAMLALVPDMLPTEKDPWNIDCSFLEPACGDGNFLVEILRRKLAYITPDEHGASEGFEHGVLRCLTSIYGVDISEENVYESRRRMRSIVEEHCDVGLHSELPTRGFCDAVDVVLETNVICADSLDETATIELIEYKPISGGSFIREWFQSLEPAMEDLNLLSPSPKRDEIPVHYSELARSARWPMTSLPSRDAA